MKVDYSITQQIPVSNHIYKYLIKICGSDKFIAKRTTIIGNFILSSLGRTADLNLKKSNYTKIFSVVINDHYYLKNGINLGFKNAQIFNNMVDIQFREEMYRHLLINNLEDKQDFYNGIKRYLEVFNITEDEIKLDTIYRDFKRKKAELEDKICA